MCCPVMLKMPKGSVFSTVQRVTGEGIEMVADVRHAGILVEALVHDHQMSVVTRGVDYEEAVGEYQECQLSMHKYSEGWWPEPITSV